MDKELLLKPRLAEEDLEIPGVGVVRLRALSRAEAVEARERNRTGDEPGDVDVDAYEADMIAMALVDPAMTAEEVARWGEVAPAGEWVLVVEKVRELSGTGEEAAKSGVPANRQERRAAVRAGRGRAPR